VIVGNRLFLAGDVGDQLRLFALDLQGKKLWDQPNGRSWPGPYPGARASATWQEGRLFHLNAHGRVAAFDAETGRELWAVDLFERFGGKNLTWALSECLLVDGSRVLVTVGGTEALMAALDARNGETVWKTEPLRLGPSPSPEQQRIDEPAGEIDNASYASPILVRFGGGRLVIGCSTRHVFAVDPDAGRLCWTRPVRTRFSVIAATPVLVGDAVFVTAPDSPDAGLYRVRPEAGGAGIEPLWTTMLDTCHGGLVQVGDVLFGAWYRKRKGWACLDARTGEVRYETDALAKGAVLYADQRLYCLSEEGDMALLKPTAKAFEFVGRFRLVPGRQDDVWTHPVIHQGRLYLRYHETLFCFDILAPRGAEHASGR
jgi:outer membrane protein assembly factor BamB